MERGAKGRWTDRGYEVKKKKSKEVDRNTPKLEDEQTKGEETDKQEMRRGI